MSDPQAPTLAGAHLGKVRPVRIVPGGIWLTTEDGELRSVPAALRLIPQRKIVACEDLARQFLKSRGDQSVTPIAYAGLCTLFTMHAALVAPPSPGSQTPLVPLFPLPAGVVDEKSGVLNYATACQLPLWDLADGQLQRLRDEYELLLVTETPPSITHAQWEAIVSDVGKSMPAKTLILQHGSSAVIQVLHGTPVEVWQG